MAEWIVEVKDGKYPIGKWTELVRCKDCKWYGRSAETKGQCNNFGMSFKPEEFCSCGVRREK